MNRLCQIITIPWSNFSKFYTLYRSISSLIYKQESGLSTQSLENFQYTKILRLSEVRRNKKVADTLMQQFHFADIGKNNGNTILFPYSNWLSLYFHYSVCRLNRFAYFHYFHFTIDIRTLNKDIATSEFTFIPFSTISRESREIQCKFLFKISTKTFCLQLLKTVNVIKHYGRVG